jgi:uncharacterized membrane protein YjjP (DUF1212 family)
MNSNEYLKIALFAGNLMLKNGGETYRIEDTVSRILNCGNFEQVECFSTLSYISASVVIKNENPISASSNIRDRGSNLTKVSMLNDFSREFTNSTMAFDVAMEKLKYIDNFKSVGFYPSIISSGFLCFGASLLINPNILTSIYCFIVGLFVQIIVYSMLNLKINWVLINITGGFFVGFMSCFFVYSSLFHVNSVQEIVVSSTIPLVPGLTLTNALRDIMDGHFVAGLSRLADAVLIATCIASGVVTSFNIFTLFGGII